MEDRATPERHSRITTAAAVGWAVTCVAVLAVGMVLRGTGALTLDGVLAVANVAAVLGVGIILTVRRPTNRVGWVVLALATVLAFQVLLTGVVAHAERSGVTGYGLTVALWLDGKSFLALWAGLMALFLLFPDGRLPSPRWRWVAAAAGVAVTLGVLAFAVEPGALREGLPASSQNPPNPTAVTPEVWANLQVIAPVAFVSLLAAFVASLASLVVRYRSADATTRVQIRWVVTAAVVFGIVLLVDVAIRNANPDLMPVADALAGTAFLLVPASVALAVLRYRLYEIDRLINRTVVYVLLSACLAAAYVVVVATLRALTAPLTGDAAPAVAVSTLAVAALFGPARRRIQAGVDRRFNRARYDAVATIERFSGRLRDEIDLDSLKRELVDVVCATMEPTGATLWVREAGR